MVNKDGASVALLLPTSLLLIDHLSARTRPWRTSQARDFVDCKTSMPTQKDPQPWFLRAARICSSLGHYSVLPAMWEAIEENTWEAITHCHTGGQRGDGRWSTRRRDVGKKRAAQARSFHARVFKGVDSIDSASECAC